MEPQSKERKRMNIIATENSTTVVAAATNNTDIRNLVYMIRGQQVMLDSDLAAQN